MLFKGVNMPAKKVIEKETIVDAALDIVRREGMDGLNMRTLAKACNCSTQPIYLSFSGADELKSEVKKRIIEIYCDYRKREILLNAYPEFKAVGMAYIRFAKEEPELFKYLFMRNRVKEAQNDMNEDFISETSVLSNLYKINGDVATQIHIQIWIWVHGIATMYATRYMNWEWEDVSKLLTDAFISIKEHLYKE